jgi:hypothetical protein
MSFAGSIRGAIAFGLAISIQTGSIQNDQLLVSTTLVLVFFTTIVFGALMPYAIKQFRLYESPNFKPKLPSKHDSNQITYKLLSENDENDETLKRSFEYSYCHPNNNIE